MQSDIKFVMKIIILSVLSVLGTRKRDFDFPMPLLSVDYLENSMYIYALKVEATDVVSLAAIVRSGMESAVCLAVPTPVRIKVGDTWGNIQTVDTS